VTALLDQLTEELREKPWFDQVRRDLERSGEAQVGGVWGTSGLLIAGVVARELGVPLLLVAPEEDVHELANVQGVFRRLTSCNIGWLQFVHITHFLALLGR